MNSDLEGAWLPLLLVMLTVTKEIAFTSWCSCEFWDEVEEGLCHDLRFLEQKDSCRNQEMTDLDMDLNLY